MSAIISAGWTFSEALFVLWRAALRGSRMDSGVSAIRSVSAVLPPQRGHKVEAAGGPQQQVRPLGREGEDLAVEQVDWQENVYAEQLSGLTELAWRTPNSNAGMKPVLEQSNCPGQ